MHDSTPTITPVYVVCKTQDTEKTSEELYRRAHEFLMQGIEERRRAVKILAVTKACLLQKEREAEEKGELFDKKEALLKAETLKILERQEKFLNDLDSGEPVEISPSWRLRKGP